MQQKIDDLCSEDQLHLIFNQLDRCQSPRFPPVCTAFANGFTTAGLEKASPTDKHLVVDSYVGSWDDLWSLRDRVVRRLITVDKYSKALQEARKAARIYL